MSGAQPLISVIIPVYNAEKYLPRAVESVLKQTFPDWELILVDDGSTDASGAICDEYAQADGRVRAAHQDNGGEGRARNAGMRAAQGAWYFFIDSDDWVEPDALERLLAHSQGADVVVGHYPEKQQPWRNVDAPKTFCMEKLTQEELSEMYFLKVFSPVWNKLYRRESITGWFEEGLFYGADAVFNLQEWANWRRIVVIPDATYHYAMREDSLSCMMRLDRMRLVRRVFHAHRALLGGCADVMQNLSRWYVEELRLYLAALNGTDALPEGRKELLTALCMEECLADAEFMAAGAAYGRVWESVLARDSAALRAAVMPDAAREPLVSIVIPVYNTQQYLPRVIESVLRQTCPRWELILVDDGSQDGSDAVCDRYARQEERIRVIHTENGGSSAARNAGMAQAVGEWLLFIDSDDWIVPEALEKLLAHSAEADVVVGHFPGQSAPWRNVDAPKAFELAEVSQEDMTELFYLRMFHSPINKLYRRERIVVPFRTDVSYIDDVTFLIANFAHWRRVVFLPDDTYRYAQRPDSLTHVFRIDRMEQVRTSLRLFGEMFPDGSPVMDTLSRWYVIELRLYWRYYAAQESVPPEVKRLMLEMWMGDDSFDHGRISTALLTGELRVFWDAVLRRDVEALLTLLANG